jgi:hypothetical protein
MRCRAGRLMAENKAESQGSGAPGAAGSLPVSLATRADSPKLGSTDLGGADQGLRLVTFAVELRDNEHARLALRLEAAK